MCTETFLRLPEEKRSRFLDAAWEEFTTVPFSNASINQIVRRAGIPRGSFYQYFTDKSDLFSYLMDGVRNQLLELFHGLLEEAEGDLFRTTVLGFDRFVAQRESGGAPQFSRCVQVLRINPGIDLEGLVAGRPEDYITEEFLDKIELSALRQDDGAFVLRVCRLTGMVLAGALMEILHCPERSQSCREVFLETLDIIRRGSLRPEALREGGIAL